MMNMMASSAKAKVAAVTAETVHTALVEVLDPDQVSLWLLSP